MFTKKYNKNKQHVLFSLLLITPFFASAQIYTWVDKNDITHYADEQGSVDQPKASLLRIKTLAPAALSEEELKLAEEKLAAEQEAEQQQNTEETLELVIQQPQEQPEQTWGGSGKETADKQCALAQAILNGSAKLVNGEEFDEQVYRVAERDAAKYCS